MVAILGEEGKHWFRFLVCACGSVLPHRVRGCACSATPDDYAPASTESDRRAAGRASLQCDTFQASITVDYVTALGVTFYGVTKPSMDLGLITTATILDNQTKCMTVSLYPPDLESLYVSCYAYEFVYVLAPARDRIAHTVVLSRASMP